MIVKVCGMRRPENIRAVEQAGADWLGFICYERSPRFVLSTPTYLPVTAKRVGVFVDAGLETITARACELGLDYIQLHGHETPDFCLRLKSEGFRLIKAFAPRQASDLEQAAAYEPACEYFLFDTPGPAYGGTGKQFDWNILGEYRGRTPFLLSGGIRPDTLEALGHFRHPQWAGIDLNSGFETAPAEKDADKLSTFIEQFKNLAL